MSCYSGPEINSNDLIVSLDVNNVKCFDTRENLFTNSNVFSGGEYSYTANAAVSPFNTADAVLVTSNSTSNFAQFSKSYTTTSAGFYSFSKYIKAGTQNVVSLLIGTNGYNNGVAGGLYYRYVFNLTTKEVANTQLVANSGVTLTISNFTPFVQELPDGWFRLGAIADLRNAANITSIWAGTYVGAYGSTSAANGTTLFVYGSQLERAATPNAYTNTGGSIVTRPTIIRNLQDNTFSNTSAINTSIDSSGTNIDFRTTAGIKVHFSEIPTYNFTLIYWGKATAAPPSDYRSTIIVRGKDDQSYFFADTREIATPHILHYTRNNNFTGYTVRTMLLNADFLQFKWNQFVMVVSPDKVMTSYRNGVLLGADSFSSLDQSTFQNVNHLFLNASASHNYQMQSVYFYKRALTAAEVKQNYDALRGRFGME